MDKKEKFIANPRKVTSIFVDPQVWKPFMRKTKLHGTSTCAVLEAFMYAYVKGIPDLPGTPLPQVNVELHIHRVVSRARRKTYPKKDGYEGDTRNIYRRPDGSFYYLD